MNLVVVPSATSGSPSSNAWPARPHLASSRHILPPTSLRALHRVPSSAAVRAYPPAPRPSASSGSVNSLETGSESPLSSSGWSSRADGRLLPFLADAPQGRAYGFIIQLQAGCTQRPEQVPSRWNDSPLPGSQHDSQRANERNGEGSRAGASGAVIEHGRAMGSFQGHAQDRGFSRP